MRVVLDTNVIISALLFGGKPEQVLNLVLSENHTVITSHFIIEEVERILQSKFGIMPDTVHLLGMFLSQAEQQFFEPKLHIITDEPDNRVLETAVGGIAHALVTGDKLLLDLQKHEQINIMTPSVFLERYG